MGPSAQCQRAHAAPDRFAPHLLASGAHMVQHGPFVRLGSCGSAFAYFRLRLPLPCLRCTCPDARSSGEWPVPFAGGDREEGKGRESEGRLTFISTSARNNNGYH